MTAEWEASGGDVAYERLTRWMDQGCPTRGPVVVEPGLLAIRASDGHRYVTDWQWDGNFIVGEPLEFDELWDYLADRYPVITL